MSLGLKLLRLNERNQSVRYKWQFFANVVNIRRKIKWIYSLFCLFGFPSLILIPLHERLWSGHGIGASGNRGVIYYYSRLLARHLGILSPANCNFEMYNSQSECETSPSECNRPMNNAHWLRKTGQRFSPPFLSIPPFSPAKAAEARWKHARVPPNFLAGPYSSAN